MNDTPTPRTNAALRYCKTRNESGREDMAGYSVLGIQKIIIESKALERELTAVTEQRDRLADLVKQFIYILDITEESDSGRLFHPTNITSCRAGDLQKIGELVEALRRASSRERRER